MLNIKVEKKDVSSDFWSKIFNKSLFSHIKTIFSHEKITLIEDSKTLEMMSSSVDEKISENVIIELTYKKNIVINHADLNDRNLIDKIICEIKDFCDSSSNMNNYSYLPLNMRNRKDDNKGTSTSGNRD
jgi:hypothetical protein